MLKQTSRILAALIFCLLLGVAFMWRHPTTVAANPPLFAAGRLSPEFQISSEPLSGDPERAAIVYNGKRSEYLVIWRASSGTLFGQRVSSTGALVGIAFVVAANGREPAVAFNATNDQYLVVWSQDGVSSRVDVNGRRLAGDGSTLGDPFVIWSFVNRQMTHPRVAWNSNRNEYFVVWGASDSTTFLATDIAGVEVSADGIPGPFAHIITVNNEPSAPDITFNPGYEPYSFYSNVYYVVWREKDPAYNSSHAIIGAISRDAGRTWGCYSYLNDRGALIDYGEPAVAANHYYFFAAWRALDNFSYNARIESRVINLSCGMNSSVMIYPQMDVLLSGDPSVAAVSGINRKFLVAWTMQTIFGRSILVSQCADGVAVAVECQIALVRGETIGPYSFVARPTATAGGPNYILAYGAHTSSEQIYGRILWAPQFLPLILR